MVGEIQRQIRDVPAVSGRTAVVEGQRFQERVHHGYGVGGRL
jgi:hypothetical protein